MPLEDEINARLRRLSEEIRNWRKDVTEARRYDRPLPSEPDRNRGSQAPHEPHDEKKPPR